MKSLIVVILLIGGTVAKSLAIDLQQIRKDYIESVNSSDKADALCKQLENVKNPDAIILGYLGSVQAIKAKHAWNPVNKMAYLKKGFATIDKAIAKDANQLEVRFLRFSLQYYVPDFLGYSKNLITDKNKIVHILKAHQPGSVKLDNDVLKSIVKFMIYSKKCTDDEVNMLKKFLV